MKRFFCTKCERVRRVRRLPVDITENMNAAAVITRVGQCDWHTMGRMRVERIPRVKHVIASKSVSASKSNSGRKNKGA